MFIQAQSDQEGRLFESQAPTVVTLIKGCKSVKVVKDIGDVPPGCGSEILTPTVVVYILVRVSTRPLTPSPPFELLQGFIDFDVEIAKREKKLNLARLNLEKIRKAESQPDYGETVPENVRLINEDKVWPNAHSRLDTFSNYCRVAAQGVRSGSGYFGAIERNVREAEVGSSCNSRKEVSCFCALLVRLISRWRCVARI